jgi:hypothetical protein
VSAFETVLFQACFLSGGFDVCATCFVHTAACKICLVGVNGGELLQAPQSNGVRLTACMQIWCYILSHYGCRLHPAQLLHSDAFPGSQGDCQATQGSAVIRCWRWLRSWSSPVFLGQGRLRRKSNITTIFYRHTAQVAHTPTWDRAGVVQNKLLDIGLAIGHRNFSLPPCLSG